MNHEVAAGTSLNRARRERELAELDGGATVDLAVVGGGVTGVGTALDAASRGLSVALLESRDLAFGTSRWSSKLVHGGLRYLASGDLRLARESALERDVLMRSVAPHLVRALPTLLPLYAGERARRSAALAGVGLRVADLLRASARTPREVLPGPRRLSVTETVHVSPNIRETGLRGGYLYWDGQLVDDARLVVAIARTAAGLGARIITRCRVTGVDRDGARAVDELTGRPVRIRARAVVNATGVWAATLAPAARLRPSRGTHLVLPGGPAGPLGGSRVALTVPVPGASNRYVLLLPQPGGRIYLGLTDEEVPMVTDVPEPTPADVEFLLGVASSALRAPIDRADVLGAFAGLRPLLDGSSARTSDLSRRHAVLTGPDGVVTVVGGKLTTYRRMAADAVDAALRVSGLPAPRPSRTATLPLVGAAPPATIGALAGELATRIAAGRPTSSSGTAAGRAGALTLAHGLLSRYGTEAGAVAAAGPLEDVAGAAAASDGGLTQAEVAFAVRHELALDADDVLDRRSRLGLVPRERAAVLGAVRAMVDGVAAH
jgi:glycerol-3-phosphate dehydrogenase